jgi:acetyl-CoA carboxylase biotin carboxyl carrier protein
MTFEEIRQLLDLVREHELSEFELEREGFKIRIRKNDTSPSVSLGVPAAVSVTAPVAGAGSRPLEPAPAAPASPIAELSEAGEEIELAVVKSPIVGTFYRSPEPSAPAFVEVGDTVKKGQVLCIIEAMKLMNEIDCEIDGVIASVYVENGQPVQYGERLFAIRPH